MPKIFCMPEGSQADQTTWRNRSDPHAKRPVLRSLWRGFRGRCPNCGKGKLFRAYLKGVARCACCGEDLSHQRADDAPPYFTMVIVGHIVVPLMLVVGLATTLSNVVQLAIWLPLTAVLTLLLLQPVKGGVIALQWALLMHGFDGSADPDAMPEWAKPVDPHRPEAPFA